MTSPNESHSTDGPRRAVHLAGLHWLHWVIVAASLLLTIVASWLTAKHSDGRLHDAFEQEADQAIGLVLERMERYEGALWAGVGLMQSYDDERKVDRDAWRAFSENVNLLGRYPGISGFGVVYHVKDVELVDYVAKHAPEYDELPSFGVHPAVDAKDHFPITYLEPLAGNERAIGLDLAFEKNRHDGALRAMRTGTAQITGPIVLVQDDGKTPGFLFYAPFFDGSQEAKNLESFRGMVYAPFVVKRLMAGVLDQDKRSVALAIGDGDITLYDETVAGPAPLFAKQLHVELYGRTWSFSATSTPSYDRQYGHSQSLTILFCGLVIDGMLLAIFWLMTRARSRAEVIAAQKTIELSHTVESLGEANRALTESNGDLEQFAYIASHDLQSPMLTVGNYARFLQEDLQGRLNQEEEQLVNTIIRAADRMKTLTGDLLEFSRVGKDEEAQSIDIHSVVHDVRRDLGDEIEDGQITIEPLPTISCRATGMAMLFRNLLANAIKFQRPDRALQIHLSATTSNGRAHIAVADNGIGIDPEYREQVFEVFKRLHRSDDIPGSGIGLAICKRVVQQAGGQITLTETPGGGATVTISLPIAKPPAAAAEAHTTIDKCTQR